MNLPKPKLTAVEVAEWDATVYVRKMSGSARADWQAESYRLSDGMKNPEGMAQNAVARLLVRVLCDEGGKPLFTTAQADELGQQDYDVLERLYDIAAPLNGLGNEAQDAAEKK
jgi:hypothetical protein